MGSTCAAGSRLVETYGFDLTGADRNAHGRGVSTDLGAELVVAGPHVRAGGNGSSLELRNADDRAGRLLDAQRSELLFQRAEPRFGLLGILLVETAHLERGLVGVGGARQIAGLVPGDAGVELGASRGRQPVRLLEQPGRLRYSPRACAALASPKRSRASVF